MNKDSGVDPSPLDSASGVRWGPPAESGGVGQPSWVGSASRLGKLKPVIYYKYLIKNHKEIYKKRSKIYQIQNYNKVSIY